MMRKRRFRTVLASSLVLASSVVLASSLVLAAAAALAGQRPLGAQAGGDEGGKPASHFVLTSPDFGEGGTLRRAQVNTRCGGHNVSPALEWHDPPDGTQSFVLLMHDLDAPDAQGFWHWIVYDIPASVSSLPENAGSPHKGLMPAGAVQGRSDFGNDGYGGPCPPPGKPHRYFFRVYAMPVAKLNVPQDASATIISSYANATALGKAQLMGLFGR